jgi:hypothetical protein
LARDTPEQAADSVSCYPVAIVPTNKGVAVDLAANS